MSDHEETSNNKYLVEVYRAEVIRVGVVFSNRLHVPLQLSEVLIQLLTQGPCGGREHETYGISDITQVKKRGRVFNSQLGRWYQISHYHNYAKLIVPKRGLCNMLTFPIEGKTSIFN